MCIALKMRFTEIPPRGHLNDLVLPGLLLNRVHIVLNITEGSQHVLCAHSGQFSASLCCVQWRNLGELPMLVQPCGHTKNFPVLVAEPGYSTIHGVWHKNTVEVKNCYWYYYLISSSSNLKQ
jgi:hypothetical protein